tara:strand:+ start:51 stop:392 length:342 start_codon:yes stop_codon:yes gene_type:complete
MTNSQNLQNTQRYSIKLKRQNTPLWQSPFGVFCYCCGTISTDIVIKKSRIDIYGEIEKKKGWRIPIRYKPKIKGSGIMYSKNIKYFFHKGYNFDPWNSDMYYFILNEDVDIIS